MSEHIEGYLVRFASNADDAYFTRWNKQTDFATEMFAPQAVLHLHGANGNRARQGLIEHIEIDDKGVYVRAKLDAKHTLGPLLDSGNAAWSSAALPHLVEMDDTGLITSWPIVEASIGHKDQVAARNHLTAAAYARANPKPENTQAIRSEWLAIPPPTKIAAQPQRELPPQTPPTRTRKFPTTALRQLQGSDQFLAVLPDEFTAAIELIYIDRQGGTQRVPLPEPWGLRAPYNKLILPRSISSEIRRSQDWGFNLTASYGYSTTPPAPINEALIQIVSALYLKTFSRTGVPSAGIGTVSEAPGIPFDAPLMLNPYRRLR